MIHRIGLLVLGAIVAAAVAGAAAAQTQAGTVAVTDVQGVIDSVVSRHVRRAIEDAGQRGHAALVLRMDTPGGLDSAMREIVQAILVSPVPVIVYVAPGGARAASAGVFVAYAAHVSAMAPGTNIGAATPVALDPSGSGAAANETLLDKATNDAAAYLRSLAELRGRNADWGELAVRRAVSVPAREAVALGVVDLMAASVPELLAESDGRTVALPDGARVLRTSEAPTVAYEMGPIDGFLHKLIDPNIAFILFSLGLLALSVELFHPGLILPGVAGVIMLLLALLAFGTLPIEPVGAGLIVFAVFLFVLESQIVSHGVLGIGGVVALVLGAMFLFRPIDLPEPALPHLGVHPGLIASLGTVMGLCVLLLARAAYTVRRLPRGGLPLPGAGAFGVAKTALAPSGTVLIDSEEWTAETSRAGLPAGTRVRVEGARGLTLLVLDGDTDDAHVPPEAGRAEQPATGP
ncbi:MAG: nodulation protein NfeD [Actinobacteria bacterium]|nr:nodulation protein NfeD [Actinomycetota bacterium]